MLFVLTPLVLSGSCRTGAKQEPLPQAPPKVPVVEVTGPEEGWPPQPKNVTNVTLVPWKEIRGSLTDSLEAEIRDAALQDRRVRRLLGKRFAYISTDEIEPRKSKRRDSTKPLATQVTFFSHTNNVAVEVTMRGTSVRVAKRKTKDQPAEGAEEIETAVALARSERRLEDKVQNLRGDAILIIVGKDQPGFGHRVLHVTFSKDDEDLPRYFAMVDLIDQKVISAGAVR